MSERTAAAKSINMTAWRNANITAGRCGRCGINPLAATGKYCKSCADLYRQEARDRRDNMRARGLCHVCGKGPLATETLCRACSDKANAGIKARQTQLRAKGLCAFCGKEPLAKSSKWVCQKCLDRRNAQRNARNHGMTLDEYREWLTRGCVICGSTKDLHIDHDHTCHNDRSRSCSHCNRGPLCSLHNTMAATLEHPDALSVLRYLTKHKSPAQLPRRVTMVGPPPNQASPDPAAASSGLASSIQR